MLHLLHTATVATLEVGIRSVLIDNGRPLEVFPTLDLAAPVAAFTETAAGAAGMRRITMTGIEYGWWVEFIAQCAANGCSGEPYG